MLEITEINNTKICFLNQVALPKNIEVNIERTIFVNTLIMKVLQLVHKSICYLTVNMTKTEFSKIFFKEK